jgi:hypothetical protein
VNEERKPKGKRPPIGSSIPTQFQSFGSSNGEEENGDEREHPTTRISRHSTVQTVDRSNTETSSSSKFQQSDNLAVQTFSNPNAKKSKHPDWKQQTVYLPPTLLKWLRVQAPQEEREISEIVTEALENYRHSH